MRDEMVKVFTVGDDNIQALLGDFDYNAIKIGNLAPLYIKITGEQFHGSLTPNIMRGILELQEGIYRSYCLAKYSSDDLRQLGDAERKKLELIVRITEGSTGLIGDLTELAHNLKELLVDMSPKQKTCVILAIVFGIMGFFSWERWLEHSEQIHNNETAVALEQEKTKQLDNAQKNIIEAVKVGMQGKHSNDNTSSKNQIKNQFSPLKPVSEDTLMVIDSIRADLPQITDIMDKASDKLLRSMKFVDRVHYNNLFEASGSTLETLTQMPRRTWQDLILQDKFRVLDIDSKKIQYRTVSLRDDKGREFTARFTDKSISKNKFNKLTKAMYGYNPIKLIIKAKELDGIIKNATIEQVQTIDTSRDYRT